jgi:hypothetical protein
MDARAWPEKLNTPASSRARRALVVSQISDASDKDGWRVSVLRLRNIFVGVTEDMSNVLSERAVVVHYRRPLRIDEINRMALTDAVKSRPSRGASALGREVCDERRRDRTRRSDSLFRMAHAMSASTPGCRWPSRAAASPPASRRV